MRVMLFIQNEGDKRPKLLRLRPHASLLLQGEGALIEWGNRCLDDRSIVGRWWLVECENAEAGRATIAHEPFGAPVHKVGCPCMNGRILASGGKR